MGNSQDSQKDQEVTPDAEAEQAEQAVLDDKSDDDIRAEVVKQYDLNADDQSDLIDSLVKDKTEERKKLGTAIRQKRDWRKKAKDGVKPDESKSSQPDATTTPKTDSKDLDADAIDKRVDARLAQRELDSAGLSDKLKTEVEDYAKLKGISVAKALDSTYIKFQREEAEHSDKTDNASNSRTYRRMADGDSVGDMEGVTLDTEEGQKDWEKRKAEIKAKK